MFWNHLFGCYVCPDDRVTLLTFADVSRALGHDREINGSASAVRASVILRPRGSGDPSRFPLEEKTFDRAIFSPSPPSLTFPFLVSCFFIFFLIDPPLYVHSANDRVPVRAGVCMCVCVHGAYIC